MERLEELSARIKKFNEDRDWDQFHTPSNLAKSISIEAGELLECFQWNDTNYNMDNVLEELADVTNYCLQMAQVLGVDIIDVVNKKMDITEKKYPVEKAKGSAKKMSTNIPQYILYIIEHHSPTMRSLQIFRQYCIFFDHAHYYNKLLVQ
mgnify:CR=1 FL=1